MERTFDGLGRERLRVAAAAAAAGTAAGVALHLVAALAHGAPDWPAAGLAALGLPLAFVLATAVAGVAEPLVAAASWTAFPIAALVVAASPWLPGAHALGGALLLAALATRIVALAAAASASRPAPLRVGGLAAVGFAFLQAWLAQPWLTAELVAGAPLGRALGATAAGALSAALLARKQPPHVALGLSLVPGLLAPSPGWSLLLAAAVTAAGWRGSARFVLEPALGPIAALGLGALMVEPGLGSGRPLHAAMAAARERLLGVEPAGGVGLRELAVLAAMALGAAAGRSPAAALGGGLLVAGLAARLAPAPPPRPLLRAETTLDRSHPELVLEVAGAGDMSGLAIVSALTDSVGLAEGTVIACLHDARGRRLAELRAGIETAEWSHDRRDVRSRVAHREPSVARAVPVLDPLQGPFAARRYAAVVRFAAPVRTSRLRLELEQGTGASLVVRELRAVGR